MGWGGVGGRFLNSPTSPASLPPLPPSHHPPSHPHPCYEVGELRNATVQKGFGFLIPPPRKPGGWVGGHGLTNQAVGRTAPLKSPMVRAPTQKGGTNSETRGPHGPWPYQKGETNRETSGPHGPRPTALPIKGGTNSETNGCHGPYPGRRAEH